MDDVVGVFKELVHVDVAHRQVVVVAIDELFPEFVKSWLAFELA